MSSMLPLVCAVTKVETAKKRLRTPGGKPELRNLELRLRVEAGEVGPLEEIKVLEKVIYIASNVVKEQRELATVVEGEVKALIRWKEEVEKSIGEEKSLIEEELWDDEMERAIGEEKKRRLIKEEDEMKRVFEETKKKTRRSTKKVADHDGDEMDWKREGPTDLEILRQMRWKDIGRVPKESFN